MPPDETIIATGYNLRFKFPVKTMEKIGKLFHLRFEEPLSLLPSVLSAMVLGLPKNRPCIRCVQEDHKRFL